MPRLLCICLAVCLLPSGPARADDKEALALLDKAVKALGGADALAKHPAATWKGSGTFTLADMKITLTDRWSILTPDKFRWELEATFNGMTQNGVLVLTAKEAWGKGGDRAADALPAELFTLLRNDLYAARLGDHLLALRDKAYTLSHLGELKINDKAAVGIKIKHKDLPDVDLYFDKETSLPVRSEVRVKEPEVADEVVHYFFFSDYKEFGGRKCFTKLVLKRDDKLTFEMERTDIKPEEKLDDSTFAKP